MQNKYDQLVEILKEMKSVVVAFSGGVDSTFLLKAAQDTLGDRAIAITVTSPFHAKWEEAEAKELAARMGVKHIMLPKRLENEALRNNPVNRCYLCKKEVFGDIQQYAVNNGYKWVVDGTNQDDTADYRPGMQALKELNVRSPLLEAGMTKGDIRKLSEAMGLSTWNKPPYACLLTRIPYGQEIKEEDLRRIDDAESYLMDLGFRQVRVRLHGNMGRIEIAKEEFPEILHLEKLEQINQRFRDLGFQYTSLDLEGYRMGKMNDEIEG
ncbi:ATP-dependent sacrificial sulfur transferase LarE [Geosporobacter ferrireducens]|uniref:TIGR00268 family protein n=1 Tax=Geosporobacter ferrireducens TaxID=1424294 RepID=A0A1D8GK50_9FIRM|nr:ATP-dependent sacrificial sulfur transferase LarE [Geosporobacter ferrireducens]AOT71283.1 TIGR00268 family protein [Geosporobacter ferrireducens]MTI58097.1 ATP-dependent sacrificial sulfur transferase LarE [Geosporobacter ferrireducens]